jgi:small subunit ribosomal protein S5
MFKQRLPKFEKPKDEFESKLLDLARIAHTRAGGKKMRFRAVVIVGDKKGKVGLGVAKGADVQLAVEKATRLSKKYLIEVPIVNQTIPYQVSAKIGAARVLLKPQKKGRGLVAGGTVRVVCTLAGIKNISSKLLGRTGNKINNARATMAALQKLKKIQVQSQKPQTVKKTETSN